MVQNIEGSCTADLTYNCRGGGVDQKREVNMCWPHVHKIQHRRKTVVKECWWRRSTEKGGGYQIWREKYHITEIWYYSCKYSPNLDFRQSYNRLKSGIWLQYILLGSAGKFVQFIYFFVCFASCFCPANWEHLVEVHADFLKIKIT